MSNTVPRYTPLEDEELQNLWEKQKQYIEGFFASNHYDSSKILIDKNGILSIIVKVEQRRQYFSFFHGLDMSEYKEAALISFWYIKLQPLYVDRSKFNEAVPDMYDSVNEKLALYIIFTTLRASLEKKRLSTNSLDNLPSEYIDELVYSLVYRDISKESLIMLVESMAVFLGMNPYVEDKRNKS